MYAPVLKMQSWFLGYLSYITDTQRPPPHTLHMPSVDIAEKGKGQNASTIGFQAQMMG